VQAPVNRQDILSTFKATYGIGECLHPDAGPKTCKGNIIKAHTIPRNGGLSTIAKDGHVYNCLGYNKSMDGRLSLEKDPNRVGIRQASTFTGFCGSHDNELFAPIETQPFTGSPDQVHLLAYRSICHELFAKLKDREMTPTQRSLDKGKPLPIQRALQEYVTLRQTGVSKAIEELEELKSHHDTMLLGSDYSGINSYVVWIDSAPEILCSAIHQATHDFRGNLIQRLGNLDSNAHWLNFSLIATDGGGAAVFSWPAEHSISEQFIDTLDELADDELPHAIVRFMFEFFENTYFSTEWWDRLGKAERLNLMKRQCRDISPAFEFPRPDDCLKDDGIRVVQWQVRSRSKS
jgi:hypothetical protein